MFKKSFLSKLQIDSSLIYKKLIKTVAPFGEILLILSLLTSSNLTPVKAANLTLPSIQKVDHDVEKALQTEGSALVIVVLEPPSLMSTSSQNIPVIKNEIANLQESVLSDLTPSEFQITYAYRTIPALAGVLTVEGLTKLEKNPNIMRIGVSPEIFGTLGESVPLIEADRWQEQGITGNGVVVAVIDSGLDTDHDDLSDDLLHEECFLENNVQSGGLPCPNNTGRQSGPGAAEDGLGHGTFVTGIITSKGTKSSVGVAPGAEIVALKVLDNNEGGTMADVLAALDYIRESRPDVKIINMSIAEDFLYTGNCENTTAANIALGILIGLLRDNGVISFAGSGNNGSGIGMTSPACISEVVSVGAADKTDSVWEDTNSNSFLDIMAPGVDITSTYLNNGTEVGSGTSFASPHAAGCAALYIESRLATRPDAIESALKSTSTYVIDPTNNLIFPRIDCFQPIIDVALIIDSSGSMSTNDPNNERLEAARAYLTASLVGDRVAVVDFDEDAVLVSTLLMAKLRNEPNQDLVTAINSIDASGLTNIRAGIEVACQELLATGHGEAPSRGAILLTDGQHNIEEFGNPQLCFAERGWPIYTFGFGDADDTLLQTIADDTGGEFKNIDNVSSLVCEYQRIRSLLAGIEPSPCTAVNVGPGETVSLLASIPSGQAQATFSTSWSGSDIVMTLTTPSGRVIDRNTIDLDVFHDLGSTFEIYSISNPETGDWIVNLFGADVPPDGEEVIFGFSTIPSPITFVNVDIKPGSDPNSINCKKPNGVIPVAILTTADFDALAVDHLTITFEGASEIHKIKKTGEPIRHEEDVDGDGDLDLVFHFRLGDTGLTCDSTEATLIGQTFDGLSIQGTDSVNMVP